LVRDFTLEKYQELAQAVLGGGYACHTALIPFTPENITIIAFYGV